MSCEGDGRFHVPGSISVDEVISIDEILTVSQALFMIFPGRMPTCRDMSEKHGERGAAGSIYHVPCVGSRDLNLAFTSRFNRPTGYGVYGRPRRIVC